MRFRFRLVTLPLPEGFGKGRRSALASEATRAATCVVFLSTS